MRQKQDDKSALASDNSVVRAPVADALVSHRRSGRRRRGRCAFHGCLAAAFLGISAPAFGDAEPVNPVATGDAVPLEEVLRRVRQDFLGHVLKVDLERENHDGASEWAYEVKVFTPQGNVLKLVYDAKTLDLLEVKGHHKPHSYRRDDEDHDEDR